MVSCYFCGQVIHLGSPDVINLGVFRDPNGGPAPVTLYSCGGTECRPDEYEQAAFDFGRGVDFGRGIARPVMRASRQVGGGRAVGAVGVGGVS